MIESLKRTEHLVPKPRTAPAIGPTSSIDNQSRDTQSRHGAESRTLKHANALADAGRLREAVQYCEQYLQHDGTSVDGHYLLGLLRDSLGEASEAIA